MFRDFPRHGPPQGDPATLELLREVMDRAPAGAVFTGLTALWLHGLDVDPLHPIDIIVPIDEEVDQPYDQII